MNPILLLHYTSKDHIQRDLKIAAKFSVDEINSSIVLESEDILLQNHLISICIVFSVANHVQSNLIPKIHLAGRRTKESFVELLIEGKAIYLSKMLYLR